MDTNSIGDLTEIIIIGRLMKRGQTVLKPISPSSKYDLVLDDNGRFIRVQCKTARLKNGVIVCPVSKTHGRSNAFRRAYSSEQVDAFAFYCPENDKCYLMNIGDTTRSMMHLRVDQPKNNQMTGIRYASDFEI